MRRKAHLVVLLLVILAASTTAVPGKGLRFWDKEETAPGAPAGKTAKVTFIELGSVRCIPCRMMQPVMDEIRRAYPDQVEVVFYDVWTEEGSPYAREYGIRVIPTQVFLDAEGREYYRHEGFFPLEEVEKVLGMQGVGR